MSGLYGQAVDMPIGFVTVLLLTYTSLAALAVIGGPAGRRTAAVLAVALTALLVLGSAVVIALND